MPNQTIKGKDRKERAWGYSHAQWAHVHTERGRDTEGREGERRGERDRECRTIPQTCKDDPPEMNNQQVGSRRPRGPPVVQIHRPDGAVLPHKTVNL